MDMQRHIVIGLGSNIDPLKNLRGCLKELKKIQNISVINVSRIYESKALLKPGAPKEWDKNYLNAAVLIKTSLDLLTVLSILKCIETKMGRIDRGLWSPREIDLDILYTDGEGINTEQLKVPHPYFYERDFAYFPTQELILIDQEFKGEKHVKPSECFFWPKLVGIVNVTEDSFSDGKMYVSDSDFIKRIDELVSQGADYIDIGAESTRPGAQPVPPELEFKILDEKLHALLQYRADIQISIDSRHSKTLRRLMNKYPLSMINDVGGLFDLEKAQLAVEYNVPYVLMHSLVIPAQKHIHWEDDVNPIDKLKLWWAEQMKANTFSNLEVIFDPGIGFGKTGEQNKTILQSLNQFSDIQSDIYIGHSRKSFMDPNGTVHPKDRDVLTALWTKKLNQAYVNYIRVHDVDVQKKALHDI